MVDGRKNKLCATLGLSHRTRSDDLDEAVLDDISDEQDLETLAILHEDLRHSHTETLQGFTDLNHKNTRLLQFTGSVFAIIAAAATIVKDLSSFLNPLTIFGLAFLILSILMLLYLSKTSSVKAGADRDVMREVVGTGDRGKALDEETYRIWICKKYTDWIIDAANQNRIKAGRLRMAETITVLGLIMVLAGILIEAL